MANENQIKTDKKTLEERANELEHRVNFLYAMKAHKVNGS